MAPLSIEIFNPVDKKWVKVGEIKPLDQPGSISDNKHDGHRDIYFFGCEFDNSKSVIYRSKFGTDRETDKNTREIVTSELQVVKELKKDETFEMKVKTDKSPEPKLIRFTHK